MSTTYDHSAWSLAVESSQNQVQVQPSCFICRLFSFYTSLMCPKQRPPTFEERYTLSETLGSGAFATVKLGTSIQDGSNYAVKIVNKSKLSSLDERSLRDEIDILRSLNHPHIIKLFRVFSEVNFYYLVTELVKGGGLFQRIVSKKTYSENETRKICKILFDALYYIHSERIAHRDLKPENLLLMSKESDSNIKIADFGFAKRLTSENSLRTKCGTPYYVAPEVIAGQRYGTKVDMWSIGVILYILLSGYPPFEDINIRRLFRKISIGKYSLPHECWGHVSDNAKDLVSRLLCIDPTERYSAEDALNHPWFSRSVEDLKRNNLGVSLKRLKEFNALRKMKGAANAILLLNTFHGKKHTLNVEYKKKNRKNPPPSSSLATVQSTPNESMQEEPVSGRAQ